MVKPPETLLRELESNQGDWTIRCELVESLILNRRDDEAASVLREVDALPLDLDERVLAARAFSYVDAGSALQILDEILDQFPQHVSAHEEKSRIYTTIGDATAALHHHERALEIGSAEVVLVEDDSAEPVEAPVLVEVVSLEELRSRIDNTLLQRQREQERWRQDSARRDQVHSLFIAIVLMVLLTGSSVLIVTQTPPPAPPQIMASSYSDGDEEALENQTMMRPPVQREVQVASTAAASSVEPILAVGAVSDMSLAMPSGTGMSQQSLGLGTESMGMGFGSMSFGSAGSGSGGGSVSFFGGSQARGNRFLFVLDHSMSMSAEQVKLRNDELAKTLGALRNAQYQVMLFAGGAYFADKGWGIDPEAPKRGMPVDFISPDGPYKFTSKSPYEFDLVGSDNDLPRPRWLNATGGNIRNSLEVVQKAPQFGGTDWDLALKLAHLMVPPPDVVFFMSDGKDDVLSVSGIVRQSKKFGSSKINCVSMQTRAGAKEFAEIARRTNGSYVIVDRNGETIDGYEYLEHPAKFTGRIGD